MSACNFFLEDAAAWILDAMYLYVEAWVFCLSRTSDTAVSFDHGRLNMVLGMAGGRLIIMEIVGTRLRGR